MTQLDARITSKLQSTKWAEGLQNRIKKLREQNEETGDPLHASCYLWELDPVEDSFVFSQDELESS